MHLFTWLDIRSLVASQLPLSVAFAFVLFGIRRVYPNPRGSDAMALGFVLWVPATLLLLAQGSLPVLGSVILPNLIILCAYIFLYRGVLSAFRAKGALPLVYDVAAVAAAVVIYFSTIYDLAFPRFAAMAVVVALTRALMAVELYRAANKRTPLLVFAGLLSALALLPICTAILNVLPATLWRPGISAHAALQSFSTLADVVFLCVSGLFGFTFFLGEIRATVEQQGQLDGVTGTLNARVIEDALTVEIARSSRTHGPVSVMLIEVDLFKAINDTYGQDRGDETLRTVVGIVGSILRFYDKCGRLAEDKFLVLLPENMAENAMVIASRFKDALQLPDLPADQPAITLSIGVTQCAFKEAAAEVIARAELALNEVRRNGRNGACMKLPNHQEVLIPHPDRIANRSRVAKLVR